jgi:carbon storage regulator CsrA
MLVVTRKVGEKVVLPDAQIEITVSAVMKNGRVRLGIKAPSTVRVFREELLTEKAAKK